MNLRRTDAIPDLVRGDIFWSGGDDSFLYLKLVGQSGSLTNLCTGHCYPDLWCEAVVYNGPF